MSKLVTGLFGAMALGLMAVYILTQEPPTVPPFTGSLLPSFSDVAGDVWIIIPVTIAFFCLIPAIVTSSYLGVESAKRWKPKRKKLPHREYEEEVRQEHEAKRAATGLATQQAANHTS